jgi:hypothetical protein
MKGMRVWAVVLGAAMAWACVVPGAWAQDDGAAQFDFAGDRFVAGDDPVSASEVAGDLFLAGERPGVTGAVGESAHLAGRRVTVDAPVGGDLYAAGYDVEVNAPVAGDATLAGYDVSVAAEVGENLRAFGRRVGVTADVGGSLLAGADAFTLDAVVAGDADLTVDEIAFGEGARVAGVLTLRGLTAEEADVPAGIAAQVRYVDLPGREAFEPPAVELPGVGTILQAAIAAFVTGVLIVAVLGLLAASVAPVRVETAVERTYQLPGETLWAGILTLSLILGGAVVLALTGIGALALPVIFAGGFLLAAAGYVMGAYALGARMVAGAEASVPHAFGGRLAAALLGAVVVGLLSLVPFLGWLVVLAVALFGVGAILPARVKMGAEAL